ncbi:MAG: cysteine desulfurase [Parcubacteria group bacterium]|nr:cysteine desulfurase [Parcubacteria group bacterium]
MRYFDYAATAPTDKRVLQAMLPYFEKNFGNPGSIYTLGRKSAQAITQASTTISKILNCKPDEFVFTGSATEADNLAILGAARINKKGKIIISPLEHKAVLNSCEILEKEGFEIVKLPVFKNGLVDLKTLEKELDEKTILVSVVMADSETGTIQPIAEISKIIKDFRASKKIKEKTNFPYFHTDASQAAKYLNIDVEKLKVDMMTISAHKLYGPKGIGGLYIRKGVKISPIIYGGGQQLGLRSGTENIPAIVGFAKALELNAKNKKTQYLKIKKLRDTLEKGILKSIPKVILNGHPTQRLPNFLNISILDIEGEAMLLYLDELGIMVSTGSACNSQSLEPSYILQALGSTHEYIHGSLRFTLGHQNTILDIKYVLKHLPNVVEKLRKISPLKLKIK